MLKSKLRGAVVALVFAIFYVGVTHADSATPVIGQGLKKLSAFHLQLELGPDGADGELLILGSVHTHDPDDVQIQELESQLLAFQPKEILVEGGPWPVAASKVEAVKKYSEMGYAYYLARQAGVPVTDADPELTSEMDQVAKLHGAELTKLYYVLRMLPQFRAQTAMSVDSQVSAWLGSQWFQKSAVMNSTITSLAELDSVSRKYLPELDDWRNVPWQWTDGAASPLSEVVKASSKVRDAHLTGLLTDKLRRRQNRILVVVGLAHLDAQMVNLIPALRSRP